MWSKKDRTEKYWSIETYLYTRVTYTVYIGTYYIAWGTMKTNIKSTQSQTLKSIAKHNNTNVCVMFNIQNKVISSFMSLKKVCKYNLLSGI